MSLLNEFSTDKFNLDDLIPYQTFLTECSKKVYVDVETHKHHILPKFMGGTNKKTNLIVLSFGDHFYAHLILAECFPQKSKERIGNISSCNKIKCVADRWLKHKYVEIPADIVEFWEIANKLTKGMFSGENNYMFGRSFPKSAEFIKNLHIGRKKWSEETFKWPDGFYKCDDIIDGSKKQSYYLCPNCGDKIFSTKRPNSKTIPVKRICNKCKDAERTIKVFNEFKDKEFNKCVSKCVVNTQTGEIYGSINEAQFKNGLTEHYFNIARKNGLFNVIGLTNSDDIINKLPETLKNTLSKFNVPDGIWTDVVDCRIRYYRKCPTCDKILSTFRIQNIISQHTNNNKCISCGKKGFKHSQESKEKQSQNKKGKKCPNYKRTAEGHTSTTSKSYIHIESGVVFKTMKAVLETFQLSEFLFKKQVNLGIFKYLGKTNYLNINIEEINFGN